MFFFFFDRLYHDPIIQKAFNLICTKKILLDGYFDMSKYIFARIKKDDILLQLKKINSKFSVLYEKSYQNENRAVSFWQEKICKNESIIYDQIELLDIECIAIVNWIYRILPNSERRIEFTKQLFKMIKDFDNISSHIKHSGGIFYNSKKVDIYIINSVDRYNKFISELKFESNQKIFFRGHSNCNYFLLPSIMRNANWLHNEREMYNQILIECPDSFVGYNTHLEKLVEMQHYELPTRLLDITRNPLVALYFACEENHDSYGEIVMLSVEEKNIKYPQSDTATILSSLPLFDDVNKQEIKNAAKRSTNDIDFNSCVPKLLHEIRLEKPAFLPKIKRDEVLDCFVVYATKNNARIIKQDGAFIICGLIDGVETINKYRKKDNDKNVVLLIDNKKGILKTLDALSINKASLFPEIESVAQYIKNRYN